MSDDHNISDSSFGMLRRCEQQWVFRYLLVGPRPPVAAMAVGTAFGEGVETGFARVLAGQDLPPRSELAEVAVYRMELMRDEVTWDEPYGKCKDQVPRMVDAYQDRIGESIAGDVAAIQERRKFRLSDGTVGLGFVDVVRPGSLIDLKTALRAWKPQRAITSLQPLFYSLPDEGDTEFEFHVTTRARVPRVQRFRRTVRSGHKIVGARLIARARRRMDELRGDPGKALPTGYGEWMCTRTRCAYWNECQAKNGLVVPDG